MNKAVYNSIAQWSGLARTCHFSSRKMAAHCGISPRQLERYFHDVHRLKLHCWINGLRLTDAIHLLLFGCSVKNVADYLGFKSRTRFTAVFKEKHGSPPTEFVSLHA